MLSPFKRIASLSPSLAASFSPKPMGVMREVVKVPITTSILSPTIYKKTSSTLKNIMAFDMEERKPTTKRLVSVSVDPPFVEPDRATLANFHTFSDVEIDQLFGCFRKQSIASDGSISESAFWSILGRDSRFFHTNSKVRSRLYSIFHTSTAYGIILTEFVLAIAVLYERSTFMTRAQLVYDVLKADEGGMVDTCILSDLPVTSESDILFRINHPNGTMDLTRTMFIAGWNKILISKPTSATELEEALDKSGSKSLLLFPFGIYTSIESLCA